ncbi:MAG: YbhB/YbcL family Raf kinase inhibitor-like protein [bacterium]
MKITSPEFNNNQKIPTEFTCDGENINPPLSFDSEEKFWPHSWVLIVEDPDAPGETFVHWLVWNIDPDCAGVPKDTVPLGGVEGLNSTGKIGYMGPCPPSGTHRYFFKLYALDTKINLPDGSTKEEVEKTIEEHVIDSAELVGLYSR